MSQTPSQISHGPVFFSPQESAAGLPLAPPCTGRMPDLHGCHGNAMAMPCRKLRKRVPLGPLPLVVMPARAAPSAPPAALHFSTHRRTGNPAIFVEWPNHGNVHRENNEAVDGIGRVSYTNLLLSVYPSRMSVCLPSGDCTVSG